MHRAVPLVLALGIALASAAGEPPEAEAASRAGKLEGTKDPKAWLAQADYCEDAGLLARRVEALKKAVELDPDQGEAHRRLDEKRRGKAWVDADEADAQEIAENQAKGLVFYGTKWMKPDQAERIRGADRKAVGWDCEIRVDTPNLVIYSGRPLPYTRKVADLLENEILLFRRLYGDIWKLAAKPKPMRVFLFGDRGAFVKRAAGAPNGGAGFYDMGGTLFVGCQTDKDSENRIFKVAVHEMLHGLDDWLGGLGELPMWLREGRADHFGYGVVGRQVIPASIREHPVQILHVVDVRPQMRNRVPLEQILSMDYAAYYRNESTYNAHAFSLVHFLFRQAGFRAYLKGLPAKGSKADFEKAVGKVPEIEKAFDAYLYEELLPALEKLG